MSIAGPEQPEDSSQGHWDGLDPNQASALRRALEAHAQVSVTDGDGFIVHVNDHFCALCGYSREELVGRAHRVLKSGHHGPEFYRALWDTLVGGRVWRGEFCNRAKGGGLYWVEATIVPVLSADGRPLQFVEVSTDITHVKDAEAALRRQNALQKIIGEAAAGLLAATASEMDAAIATALAGVGRALGVDRAYLFQCDAERDRMTNSHEWCAPGVRPYREASQDLAMSAYPWWCRRMDQRAPLVLDAQEDLPAEAVAERVILEERQARAVIAFPLHLGGRSAGFIGCESITGRREWALDEVELVENLADFLSNALARWRAEEALAVSKERLRRGQAFANIGTWEWDIPSGELYWSERIPVLFGYPQGDLETSIENFMQAVHPEDRAAITAAIEATLERDEPYDLEHRVVWPDGTVRWLLERGAVVRDDHGMPLQMLGVVQDIDDRKRAELALGERERQLREAQALARLGNWRADFRTGELTWSEEIYHIFGYPPGDHPLTLQTFYDHVHPEDRGAQRRAEREAAATGRYDLVHRIVRPDGAVRHMHELAQAERDTGGRLLSLTGTVQDVTERVEAEQALIAARDEAERANRAKSEFLSAMSHELRTPMNAILGFGQLMEYAGDLPAEHRDSVQEILKAGHHLLELINEVLDLAKVESGRVDLSLEPVEVDPVTEECLSLVTTLADRRGIHLEQAGTPGLAVRADRTRLKQALLNLLSNAIKYNRESGRVVVETRTSDGDRVQVRVRDTGPGIPPERQGDLFQPFNRLGAEHSEIEGTGIGLTLTRRIVEMMGGRVEVESRPGAGSTFWLELPREAVATLAAGDGPGVATDDSASAAATGSRHTVLYIEDNPANLKLVAQLLGRRPQVQLLTAHAPGLGIELARARAPDLILLDINLPGMDGYQVMEVFQADPRLARVPVVAVTANAMPRDIARGMTAGFADYLTKPLDVARFDEVLDRLLGGEP